MSVNVRPHSVQAPLELDDDTYQQLVKRKESGWSHCADETEWLAKLHYLRSGYRAGKLDHEQFEEREARLVQAWLRRLL